MAPIDRLPPGITVVDPRARTWEGYSLRELLERPELLEPPVPLVERLLWKGRHTLVSATDKAGKSTLGRQAAVALTRGSYFLGQRVNNGVPAAVLWVGFEEALGDMVRPLHALGADPDLLDIVVGLRDNGVVALADAVRSRPYAAVFIDTLSALGSALQIVSQRDETEMTVVMQAILRLAREPQPFGGPAVCTLHHHTRGSKDAPARERGSGAIPANCDVIVNMTARKGDPSMLDVVSRGRAGMAPKPFALKWSDGQFLLADAALAPVAAIVRQTDEVWTYLHYHPHASASSIALKVGIKKATVLDILTELEHQGRARNVSDRPNRPDWTASTVPMDPMVPMVPTVPGTIGTAERGRPISMVPTVPSLKGVGTMGTVGTIESAHLPPVHGAEPDHSCDPSQPQPHTVNLFDTDEPSRSEAWDGDEPLGEMGPMIMTKITDRTDPQQRGDA